MVVVVARLQLLVAEQREHNHRAVAVEHKLAQHLEKVAMVKLL
jgi:hypothetical protein